MYKSGFRGGSLGSVEPPSHHPKPPLTKFYEKFSGKFDDFLIPKYSYPYSLPYTSFQQVHFTTCECM